MRTAGAQSLGRSDNKPPCKTEEGCLICPGEIRVDFQVEVTPKVIPESGIGWVRLGVGQGTQGKLLIHKEEVPHPQPLA